MYLILANVCLYTCMYIHVCVFVYVSVHCHNVCSGDLLPLIIMIMELFINTNTPLVSQIDQILFFLEECIGYGTSPSMLSLSALTGLLNSFGYILGIISSY